ncbi:chitin-binding domain protein cbd-1-like isoform X2 [Dreissena polymorpha]|uniref:Chitin-binding type-2 domain-containing protein n=1 Tax=Dreissena polymorpha TaxID=45954 RepID=A0A9D4N9Y9_DREPO|nr:chitin-binding domain protein cbd-1-like isoform X1 [Dreissena polymorpha]XP_052242878.1 chitin-binding domain protein cbd-1-like isoform X2 [Dreissena polymorpha]KAH3890721.1 hypothetical protein DPMN_014809 [Dreissena polymorpha]
MDKLIVFTYVLACVGTSNAVNCTALPDGVYEAGCKSYALCTDGRVSFIDCPENTTFNNNTNQCDNISNVLPPCGRVIDCSTKPYGRYPDYLDNCKSFYTCYAGEFQGHNFCPGGTVFDPLASACNWKFAVAPPCGTFTA